MQYEIIQKFISKNRSYKALTAVGTVVHETADPGATDENEFNYFNTGSRGASAHAFVDCDSITQTIPWDEQSWHAGGTANRTRIGIELCHYDDEARFNEVWKRAVWLFAWVHVNVIKQTAITTENLMSHAEVTQRWHESTHTDPVSYFAQFGKTVDDFRNAVQQEISNMIGQPQQASAPQPSINGNILKLQQTLNRLKIRDGKGNTLAEDGILGNCTREATKRLQSICGLEVDGIAGNNTWNAINSILSKPLTKIGARGLLVRYLQYRVGAVYDGVFGWDTNRKIAIWQGQNGLVQDGIVGQNTWAKLIV